MRVQSLGHVVLKVRDLQRSGTPRGDGTAELLRRRMRDGRVPRLLARHRGGKARVAVAALGSLVVTGLAFVAPASATPTYSSTATIPVGSEPATVAVNPTTGKVYVGNRNSRTVSVIDEATNQVTATIDLPAAPGLVGTGAIAVNPATNTIYAGYDTTVPLTIGSYTYGVYQGEVAVIDGATNQIATTITLPLDSTGGINPQISDVFPVAMAVDASTNTLYVATANETSVQADDTVAVINGLTNQVATSIDLPTYELPTDVAVNSTTDRVYVTTLDTTAPGGLWIIDGSTNTSSLSIGGYLTGVAVDETTDTAYAADSLYTELDTVDGAGNSTGVIPAGGNLAGVEDVAVDAGTSYAYVTNGNNTLTVVNLATGQITASFAVGSGPTGVAVDPVTDTVYVANSGSNTVSAIAIGPPSASAGGGYSGQGGSPIAVSGTASDNYQSAPTTTWSATANSGTDGTCSFANAAAPTTSVTCNGPGTYTLTLTADDGLTAPATSTAQLTVTPAPIAVYGTGVIDQYTLTVATPFTLCSTWSDPDTVDTLTATIDWGDGTTSTPQGFSAGGGSGPVCAKHQYTSGGTYTATVTVSNDLNPPVTASQSIQITISPNTPPTVSAGWPLYTGTEGSPVALDGTAADPDGDTLTSQWSIGAQTADGTCTFADPAALATTVTCTDQGHYELILTVNDGVNNMSTYFSTAGLTLTNAPITVGAISGLPALGASVSTPVTANATFNDPGTVGAHTANIDWGDGTTSTATVAETVGSGAGSVSGSHSYATPGTYTVSVSVSDQAECVPDGFYGGTCLPGNTLFPAVTGTNSAQVIVNAPITATADGPYNGAEGSAITVSGTATDNVGATVTTAWTAAPSSGTDGTCTFANPTALDTTVTCTDDGSYTLTLTATDGVDAPVTTTAPLTVANAPITVGAVTASPSLPVAINVPVTVSAGFTDPGNADAHTATIDWGDNTSSPATVTETVGSGSGSVSAGHSYAAGGTYTVTVTVNDGDSSQGSGTSSTQVTVNTPPTPSAAGPYSGAEGSTIAVSGTATDVDGDAVTTVWSATANAGTDGTCTFANPAALNTTVTCTDEGSYTLTLTAADGINVPVTSTAALTVSNAPITVGDLTGQPKTTSLAVSAGFTDPGTADAHTATIDWGDGTSSPETVTETVGTGTGSVSGTHSYAEPGTYTVTVTVSDGDSPAGSGVNSAPFTLNTPPVVNAGGGTSGYSGAEGSPISLSGTATDVDGDAVATGWSATANSGTDGTCTFADPAALNATVACTDDGSYTLTLAGSDGVNPTVTSTAHLTVSNAPITVGAVTASPSLPVAIGSPVTVNANFTDPGTADAHTAIINWGDGTTSPGTVNETVGTGTGSVSGTHSYIAAGVYTVTVTVSDGDSPAGTGTNIYQYSVVYDPAAGFVTGAGTITSPAGALVASPNLTGPATFGFVSKYQKGNNTPVGQTQFQFQMGNLDFHSSTNDPGSLVISGPLARYTGTGSITGSADSYSFLVEAFDCTVTGRCATYPDGFRIEITDTTTQQLVYDNVPNGTDALSQANTEPIATGEIVIHKAS